MISIHPPTLHRPIPPYLRRWVDKFVFPWHKIICLWPPNFAKPCYTSNDNLSSSRFNIYNLPAPRRLLTFHLAARRVQPFFLLHISITTSGKYYPGRSYNFEFLIFKIVFQNQSKKYTSYKNMCKCKLEEPWLVSNFVW